MKEEKVRILEIDALRGIAAGIVLLFHYTTKYGKLYGHDYPVLFQVPWGHYGVQLFFIISGFVIFMTLDRTKNAPDFVISRFSRLYPVYWFSILLTSFALMLFPLPKTGISLTKALMNLTMLQKWFGVEHVDGVYWSLFVEIGFYFWMFILLLFRLLSKIELIGISWLLVILSWKKFFDKPLPDAISQFILLDYWPLFFSGILFYLIKKSGHTLLRHVAIFLSLAAYGVLNNGKGIFIISLFFAVFYSFLVDKATFLLSSPLLFLGKISYSLYLQHHILGYIVMTHLYSIRAHPILILLVPTVFSLTLAYLSTVFIEQPALRAIRAKYWERK